MMLSGLNPDQVLEIANRSISFYTYQLFNENRLKDEMLKRDKEEFENLRSYCGSLKTKYKTDIEKFQRSTLGKCKSIVVAPHCVFFLRRFEKRTQRQNC